MIDTVFDEKEIVMYPTEFLKSLDVAGMPSHILNLKIGASMMLLRNLNSSKLCNCTKLTIKAPQAHVVQIIVRPDWRKGENVFLPDIALIT